MLPKKQDFSEKRAFIRLEHVFPVEFQFLDVPSDGLAVWYQAFTQDINEMGLCLTINHLDENAAALLEAKQHFLLLHINIPLGSETVTATGRPVWTKRLKSAPFSRYQVGVVYERMAPKDNIRIMRYVKKRKLIKVLAITLAFVLSCGVVMEGYLNRKLHFENNRLLSNLSANTQSQKNLIDSRRALEFQIQDMSFLLSQSQRKIDILQENLLRAADDGRQKIAELSQSLKDMQEYQDKLKGDLTQLLKQKVQVEGDVRVAVREADILEQRVADKLYQWLVLHQNNRTGLVASFEGDSSVNDLGFTYDQALAAIVFLHKGDLNRARQIFNFFQSAQKIDSGACANAYFVSSGEVGEYVAHAGPNIWLAIALSHYMQRSHDLITYSDLLQDVVNWLDRLKDEEAGLRGGERLSWYSTEHNLDAYAMYQMLAHLTGNNVYQDKAKDTLIWLNKNAYSKISSPVVKRGKGDATIATDTYAWSIAAIGPRRLKESGMDPDGIMDFAIQNCAVTVEYEKPDGIKVKVKGFDFAKHQNLARGGVVSSEWTSQMIVSLTMMANYHARQGDQEKKEYYHQLSQHYISEMSKMIITSLSPVGQGEFCLPYASHEFVDTGHGWRTPKGKRTGSVAGTAYYYLAIEGFNPLQLDGEPSH
ncbi:MAG: hypothetical protein ABIC68_05525 [Candidatus Omnitrophota bacterium]